MRYRSVAIIQEQVAGVVKIPSGAGEIRNTLMSLLEGTMGQLSGIHPVVHAIVAANCGGREDVVWHGMAGCRETSTTVPQFEGSSGPRRARRRKQVPRGFGIMLGLHCIRYGKLVD